MLEKILAHKRAEIERLTPARDDLRRRALATATDTRPFLPPSAGGSIRLIAELKRASPSRGLLAPHLDLRQVAQIYADNGAAALSVLTDEKFFQGRLDLLTSLRFNPPLSEGREARGEGTAVRSIPLLRKDFILAPVQLYQTRAAGADAVLLIAAALPDDAELADLHALALELGLTPLVEVHTQAELERSLRLSRLKLLGINNRDLTTFNVTLETTARLRPLIPAGIQVVSESGIFTAADVARLAALDVHACLVGEALVTAPDIAAKVRELAGCSPLLAGERTGGEVCA